MQKEPDEAVSFVTKFGIVHKRAIGRRPVGPVYRIRDRPRRHRTRLSLLRSVRQLMHLAGSKRRFRIGIIGCGQIGTAIATRLLLWYRRRGHKIRRDAATRGHV